MTWTTEDARCQSLLEAVAVGIAAAAGALAVLFVAALLGAM